MFCYASRTGTRRNLDAMRECGWGILVSRAGVWRTEGFSRWCGDNGAWADYQAGREFDEDEYERFLEWVEAQKVVPDFLVLPDIVAGGAASLALSTRYLNRCMAIAPLVLIAVQDGMSESDLLPLVGPRVGVFLGGSTKWKLETMWDWGRFCAQPGEYEVVDDDGDVVRKRCYYHAARVNSAVRMRRAIAAFAQSVDGTSATMYEVTIARLAAAARQRLDDPFKIVSARYA